MKVNDPLGFTRCFGGKEAPTFAALIKRADLATLQLTHAYTMDTLKAHVIPDCEEQGFTLVKIISAEEASDLRR